MNITSEKKYLESLERTSQFFEQSSEAVIITDKNGIILDTNTAFSHISGYTKDEVLGKTPRLFKSGNHDANFYENMWATLKYHDKWQGEIWNKRKNGETYPLWLSITKFTDINSNELKYMAIFTDISVLKKTDEKLKYFANHDHLTGLLNKAQFENTLDHTINKAIRNNKKFALLFIDLDYFKDVNDTAGHNVGDIVLKQVAQRFLKVLRKEDIVARIGGDEFNVIIDGLENESDILLLVDKLRDEIKRPFKVNNKKFYLSISVGVSIFPYHGLNVTELSKNADSAMYEVKKSGRDGVLLYDKKFTDNLIKQVSLFTDLKNAIKHKKLELYYQLVYDVNKQRVIGAEALIRWRQNDSKFISPEQFIPIAEHHGLIKEIGEFVLKTVCEDLPQFLEKYNKNFILSFNVSSKEFANKNFVQNILDTIKKYKLSAKNLEIEITETVLMDNHALAIDKMLQLRKKGFNISIDDFGTGYSSLSYLKKFPVNKVKIDKSFVLDIVDDEDDYDMVKAIITIAKIFHLEVQAEGVETKEHLEILKELKVDVAQGFYFAKPKPLKEL